MNNVQEQNKDAQEGIQSILAGMGVGSTSVKSQKNTQSSTKESVAENIPASVSESFDSEKLDSQSQYVDRLDGVTMEEYNERFVDPMPKGLEYEVKSSILISRLALDLVRNSIFYLGLDTSINNYINNIIFDHFREYRSLLNGTASSRDPSNFIPKEF